MKQTYTDIKNNQHLNSQNDSATMYAYNKFKDSMFQLKSQSFNIFNYIF